MNRDYVNYILFYFKIFVSFQKKKNTTLLNINKGYVKRDTTNLNLNLNHDFVKTPNIILHCYLLLERKIIMVLLDQEQTFWKDT